MSRNNKHISIKYLTLVLLFIFMAFTISCGGLKSRITDVNNLNVGYVVKKGNLEDKSLTELGYQGIKESVNEFNLNVNVLEGEKNNQEVFQGELKKLTEKNDVIIVMGDEFKASINAVANNYRDKKFAVFGEGMKESNIQDITFRYEEGGYLMGILAGKETKGNKIGFIGSKGNDTDKLLSGYIAGAKVVNSEAGEGLLNGENVRYVEEPISNDKIFTLGKELYNNGVDIVFTNLGKESIEIFKVAKAEGKYAIGLGMDLREVYKEYEDNIISSLVVKVDRVVYETIKEAESGKFKSGEKNSKSLGLKNGTIDIAASTEKFVQKDLMNMLETYKKDIINKKIVVPKNRQEALEYKINNK